MAHSQDIISGQIMMILIALLAAYPGPLAEQHPVALSQTQLDLYSGRFQDEFEPEIIVSIYRDGDHLKAETERLPPLPLKPVTKTEFVAVGPPIRLAFALDKDGRARSFTTTFTEPRTDVFRRIGDAVRHHFRDYALSEVTIPMRDGVKLHAAIARPADTDAPLPILLRRTPYSTLRAGSDMYTNHTELARSGYIFVSSDIRGRYQSEGVFVMTRPLADHTRPGTVDESTDAYDTVDWLIKNIPRNNGRVGVAGISYDGLLAIEAGIDPHPAIKAISPQAPMIDVWTGDDWFHNGAFRQTVSYDYILRMESSKDERGVDVKAPNDEYEFYLKAGSFDGATRSTPNPNLPSWVAFREHPAYDEYWRDRAVQHHLSRVAVPTLTVGGYYDQEDMWGAQEEYAALERSDSHGLNFLVLGPWWHGQWQTTTRHLAELDWHRPTTDEFRAQFEAPFFAKYLKDEPGFDLADTASFQTGSNTWQRYGHWPPSQSRATNLFLQASGTLSGAPPATSRNEFVTYVSDPNHPVPYVVGPVKPLALPSSHWRTWLAEDQRSLTTRKDVALWQTGPLESDVTVTGEVLADLFAATSGSDADWVMKLLDVYPGNVQEQSLQGYQLMTNAEIFRGRYRHSFSSPEPIPPDAVQEYKWSLHGVDHVFKAGHRIMVTVQSTWFPLYDRNPQRYVPNIMLAQPKDFAAATQRIYTSPSYPSRIILPVIKPTPRQSVP